MDGWVDGWVGGWMDGWMDGWIDGCVYVQMIWSLVSGSLAWWSSLHVPGVKLYAGAREVTEDGKDAVRFIISRTGKVTGSNYRAPVMDRKRSGDNS